MRIRLCKFSICSFLFILLVSCGTNKVIGKKKNVFKQLDSIQKSQRIINFSFGKEKDNWLTYADDIKDKTGSLSYYKKINDTNYHQNFRDVTLNVSSDEVENKYKDRATIDNYLHFKTQYYKKWFYKDFKYDVLNFNHKTYGKGYVLRYSTKSIYLNDVAEFLFYYKGFGYTIKYNVINEYFDKYLPDVQEMVVSFIIEE